MNKTRILATFCCLGLASLSSPVLAWETVEPGPFSFLSHHYGDDMYRAPITPDRPYWHGDDAVPPDLRWHDRQIEVVDEYGFTVGTLAPESEVVSVVNVGVEAESMTPRPRVRRLVIEHRRKRTRLARMACPPASRALPPAEPMPSVPAPTEH